jgi:hypothetical protein
MTQAPIFMTGGQATETANPKWKYDMKAHQVNLTFVTFEPGTSMKLTGGIFGR